MLGGGRGDLVEGSARLGAVARARARVAHPLDHVGRDPVHGGATQPVVEVVEAAECDATFAHGALVDPSRHVVGHDSGEREGRRRTEHPAEELRPLHVLDVTPGRKGFGAILGRGEAHGTAGQTEKVRQVGEHPDIGDPAVAVLEPRDGGLRVAGPVAEVALSPTAGFPGEPDQGAGVATEDRFPRSR